MLGLLELLLLEDADGGIGMLLLVLLWLDWHATRAKPNTLTINTLNRCIAFNLTALPKE